MASFVAPIAANGIDERLILLFVLASSNGARLLMSRLRELRRIHVEKPKLGRLYSLLVDLLAQRFGSLARRLRALLLNAAAHSHR